MGFIRGSSHLGPMIRLYACLVMLATPLVCPGVEAKPHNQSYPYEFRPPPLPKPTFEFTCYAQSKQNTISDPNTFAITLPVAGVGTLSLANQSWFSNFESSFFGATVVFENPLTLAVAENSTEVGRGRGIAVFDKLYEDAEGNEGVEWMWTAVFNEASGLGNSSLCFRGYDAVFVTTTKLVIVGGTGKFTLARGYANFKAVALTNTTGTFELNAHVWI